MHPRRAALVIAILVALLGVGLALTSLSVGQGVSKVECGSAADPSYVVLGIEDITEPRRVSRVSQCEDAVSSRRAVSFPLVGVGALALLYLRLTAARETKPDEARPLQP